MPNLATPIPLVSVFSFGSPIDTGAFASPPSAWSWSPGTPPAWCRVTESASDGTAEVSVALGKADKIAGLGLHVGPLNCRGNTFCLFSTDNSVHTPAVRSMYGAHSFHLILREKPVGLFVDSPSEVTIDAGCTRRDTLSIRVSEPGWRLAIIEGSSPTEIIHRYLLLTGTPYIPPRWAFGFHQSRWSYENEAAVREVAESALANDIPLDVIHLDIHYMDGYRVFTVDESRFPNLEKLSADLFERGIRLVSILDPGVKAEKGFPLYDEGKAKGFFCTKADGKELFEGAVWPGRSVFPDFFRADVRHWWGAQYQKLQSMGISGFWNDMNEPAIFYTPESLGEFAQKIDSYSQSDEHLDELSSMISRPGLGNRRSYCEQFLHEVEGEPRPNKAVHNLYGTLMTKATADSLAETAPNKRHFLLSRSSYTGMHRYAAIWTGDNHSWWEHLALNVQQLISLNMSGFLFCGADTGGFWGDSSPDLLVRWTQLSAFSPFCRNHSCLDSRRQEPWAFDQETLGLCRDAIKLRYAIMPYLYGEFVRAALSCQPFIRGLFLDHDDARDRLTGDQFMCGPSLLVAPVLEPAATQRHVWLPRGAWLEASASAAGLSGKRVVSGGDTRLEVGIGSMPVFLRNGSLVPMAADSSAASSLSKGVPNRYKLLGFTDTEASCWLLLDDGETAYKTWEEWPKCEVKVCRGNNGWSVAVDFGAAKRRPLELEIEMWDSSVSASRLTART